jgi:hypothetical protein
VSDVRRKVRPAGAEPHPAEHALVDEAQLSAVVEVPDHSGVRLQRRVRGVAAELPTHAEVSDDRIAVVERQPEELAATPRLQEPASDEYGLEVVGAGNVAPNWSWVQDAGREDRATGDQPGETRTYGLDFW